MQNSWKNGESFFKRHAITFIMWWLLFVIGGLLFSDFSKSSASIIPEKIDPYVLSTKGSTIIIRDKEKDAGKEFITVAENNKGNIFVWDKVKTLDSRATIYWPDGSITRLGERSSIKIHELQAETTSENIKIDFSLESGKSWSNVIRYMFGESHFHERFNNDTSLAAVRGTVFEVNLEQNYIHTIDHSVSVRETSGTGETLVVNDGVIDATTKKVVTKDVLDINWNKLNHDADIVYINEKLESIKRQLLIKAGRNNYMDIFLEKIGLRKPRMSLGDILNNNGIEWEKFSAEMRSTKNSKELIDIYQQFYGLGNTSQLLETKMKLRDLIIETAPEKEKKMLLDDFARSTLYDSWDVVKSGSGNLEPLKKKLEEYLMQGANKWVIDGLKKAAEQDGVQNINSFLENAKDITIKTLGEKNLIEEAKKEINAEQLEKINNTTTTIRSSATEWFKNIIR